jgi:hypothetical protein
MLAATAAVVAPDRSLGALARLVANGMMGYALGFAYGHCRRRCPFARAKHESVRQKGNDSGTIGFARLSIENTTLPPSIIACWNHHRRCCTL